MSPETRYRRLLDRMGAFASFLCALHCAALPVVIAVLPSLGVSTWLGGDIEVWFVLFATSVGLFSVIWGYRHHRGVRALGLLLPGLIVLWFGILYAPLHEAAIPHAITMTLGGVTVALAHLANMRLVHVHDATCVH